MLPYEHRESQKLPLPEDPVRRLQGMRLTQKKTVQPVSFFFQITHKSRSAIHDRSEHLQFGTAAAAAAQSPHH